MKPLSIILLLTASIVLFGCNKEAKLGCEKTSLRHDCVTIKAKALDAPIYSQLEPFESTKLKRSYLNAPPQIPHSIVGVTIDKADNGCLNCHFPGEEPVPALPKSHMLVPKISISAASKPQVTKVKGFKSQSKPDAARYFCTQCHVPQATNLKPLVANQF